MFLPKLTRTPLLGFASCLLSLGLLGCSEDLVGSSGDEDAEVGDEAGEVTGDEGDELGDGETGEELPVPGESFPAAGISITTVEANQGSAVLIGEAGEWVSGGARLGALIRDRDTLIRVHYDIDEAWVPREIDARLLVEFSDGTSKTWVQRRMVAAPSTANSLGGTFSFGLVGEAGHVSPGARFKVELHEISEGAGAGASAGVWQTPPEPELLGVQPEPMELKIVFVPFHHLYGSIDRLADTSDANMKIITDLLFERNALTEIIWEVHEPMLWDKEMNNLGSVLGPTTALRDNELALPNVYYHALFPVPGGGVNGVAGIASVAGDGKGDGNLRVSATALGSSVRGAAHTVTHEVGHNAGMAHVYCPFGAAASPDLSYPYQNGVIGQWGFGVISHQLYSPTNTYDYMSYCGPTWVSTWSWAKSFQRVRTLTSWDYEGAARLDFELGPVGYQEQHLLIGSIVTGDDEEFWWTSHGTLPSGADPYGDEYAHHVELRRDGQLVAALPSVVRYTNDYSTAWLISELPPEYARLEGVDAIVRVDDQAEEHLVSRSAVQLSAR